MLSKKVLFNRIKTGPTVVIAQYSQKELKSRCAFLFPGQGTQYESMGKVTIILFFFHNISLLIFLIFVNNFILLSQE